MKYTPSITLSAAAAALAILACVPSAKAQATTKPDGQWRAALGLGASATGGNTKATSFSLTGDAVRATADDKVSLYGTALRTSNAGVTTAEQLRSGGRYDYNLGTALFGFGGADLERNTFANLKLRSQLGAGLGWHLVKTPELTWDLFGGLAYTQDSYVAPTAVAGRVRKDYHYAALLLGEESSHALSASTRFKQRLVLLPNLNDSRAWRASWDAGLSVAMSSRLSLTAGLAAAYNADPGLGRKKLDTLFTTGVGIKFE